MYNLKDSSIKEITAKAIEYFSTIDLTVIANKIHISYDFYREISNKYPTAMKALIELSKCTSINRERVYEPNQIKVPLELEELYNNIIITNKSTNMEDGITESFNPSLCNFLTDIKEGNSNMFVTDCFKMTLKNF